MKKIWHSSFAQDIIWVLLLKAVLLLALWYYFVYSVPIVDVNGTELGKHFLKGN